MHNNVPHQLSLGDKSDYVFVLVHGRTQSPADMEILANRLASLNIRYVLPEAHENTWYPVGFLAPIADNEPKLSAAIEHYNQTIEGLLAEGVPLDKIVVGGFSQGACLTAEFLARHPRRYAAAVIWTGGLIGPKGTIWPLRSQLKDMPVYITTANDDPWVPAERARETYEWLYQSGACVSLKIFESRPHSVLDEEIDVVREMLRVIVQ